MTTQTTTPPTVMLPPETPDDPKSLFISKRETAERLRISVRTLDRWMERRLVPFYKVRGNILFDWPDLTAHLRRRFRITPIKGNE